MDGGKAYSELENKLLKEGFVTPEDMASAKETRQQNLVRAQKPIGLLISDIANLPQDEFKRLLRDKKTQEKIAAIGLEKGLFSREQLNECQRNGDAANPLSVMLVHKGYLTENDRKVLLQRTLESIDFAKLAISLGLISELDLERALKLKSHQKSVCEILYDRNLVTLSELNHVFRKFSQDLKLGQILLLQELLTETQLKEALSEQSASNLSLGKILLKRRYVAVEQLYFTLSIQYNTPFQKLDGYVYYEKQKMALREFVGQGYALENRILPLFQSGNNLTLAVSNPANIWSMHGLKSLYPELQMNCVLITDEKFGQLYALLYGEMLYTGDSRQPPQSGAATPDQTLQLKHPATQKELMKKLYEEYRYYQETAGLKPFENEEPLFYSFISENHQHLCERYRCKEILFRFEVHNGRTEVLASPVT
ncbi:MAG: hypothetical protein RBT11_11780 [Desulfobacterales bacterium]|nr:hypothetical protein [Desulfobacterales bacterium]